MGGEGSQSTDTTEVTGSQIKVKMKLLGIFLYLDDLLQATENLKQRNVRIETVFSPVPRHEIQEALGVRPSPVRYFTFLGGLLGVLFGLGLATYAHLQWSFVTSGKPVIPPIPFVVIAFEFCVLVGVFSAVVGMLFKGNMPRFRLPDDYDPRFSVDRFGLVVTCKEGEDQEVVRILREAGVEEVREIKVSLGA